MATESIRKSSWIPWVFVAGFGLVCAVNGAMIYFATTSWTGLVTERSYDKGIAYNRNLAAEAAQAGLGWQAGLTTRPVGDGQELEVRAVGRGGVPLSGAVVDGKLERPLRQGQDIEIVLRPIAPGRYVTTVALAEKGLWQAHLRITKGNDRLVIDERLDLR